MNRDHMLGWFPIAEFIASNEPDVKKPSLFTPARPPVVRVGPPDIDPAKAQKKSARVESDSKAWPEDAQYWQGGSSYKIGAGGEVLYYNTCGWMRSHRLDENRLLESNELIVREKASTKLEKLFPISDIPAGAMYYRPSANMFYRVADSGSVECYSPDKEWSKSKDLKDLNDVRYWLQTEKLMLII